MKQQQQQQQQQPQPVRKVLCVVQQWFQAFILQHTMSRLYVKHTSAATKVPQWDVLHAYTKQMLVPSLCKTRHSGRASFAIPRHRHISVTFRFCVPEPLRDSLCHTRKPLLCVLCLCGRACCICCNQTRGSARPCCSLPCQNLLPDVLMPHQNNTHLRICQAATRAATIAIQCNLSRKSSLRCLTAGCWQPSPALCAGPASCLGSLSTREPSLQA